MTLTLRKLQEPNEWIVNGIIFRNPGALYLALDMALAIMLKRDTVNDLPDNQWTYHKDTNTYTTELELQT